MERLVYVILIVIVLAAGFETANALAQDTQKNVYVTLTGVK